MPAELELARRRNARILLEAAARLGCPVVATEQYRRGLGDTVPAVRAQADGLRQPRLAVVVGDEGPAAELERAGHVQHIEGAGAEARGVGAAEVAGTDQRPTPEQVGEVQPALGEILFEIGPGAKS